MVTKAKKKTKKNVARANAYIQASFGNTMITFTELNGDVLTWSTAGVVGFKGSKKGTPFAAQLAAEDVAKKAKDLGVKSVSVYISGPGGGRESALRAFSTEGFRIEKIEDITPVPHNGCRPPKKRRV